MLLDCFGGNLDFRSLKQRVRAILNAIDRFGAFFKPTFRPKKFYIFDNSSKKNFRINLIEPKGASSLTLIGLHLTLRLACLTNTLTQWQIMSELNVVNN